MESEYGKGSTFSFDIVQKVIDASPCEYSKNRKGIERKQFAIDFAAPKAKMIRAIGTPYTDKLPVVALSANAVKGMETEFLVSGMNDFLPKPIDLEMLGKILRKWLPQDTIQETESE